MKTMFVAMIGTLVMGAALAQVSASSSVYLLDIDPARYAGPAGKRVAVTLGDEPRHIRLGTDEICVQLKQAPEDSQVIQARVRVLLPEPHDRVDVRLVAPDISPGTYRATPWGMLLRVVNPKSGDLVKPMGTSDAPVCTL